jgi:hypothetical protein
VFGIAFNLDRPAIAALHENAAAAAASLASRSIVARPSRRHLRRLIDHRQRKARRRPSAARQRHSRKGKTRRLKKIATTRGINRQLAIGSWRLIN